MPNLTDTKHEQLNVADQSGKTLVLNIAVKRIGLDTQMGVIWKETTAVYTLEDGRDVTPFPDGRYKVTETGEILRVIK